MSALSRRRVSDLLSSLKLIHDVLETLSTRAYKDESDTSRVNVPPDVQKVLDRFSFVRSLVVRRHRQHCSNRRASGLACDCIISQYSEYYRIAHELVIDWSNRLRQLCLDEDVKARCNREVYSMLTTSYNQLETLEWQRLPPRVNRKKSKQCIN